VPIVFEVNAPLPLEYRRYHREFRLVPGLGEWTEAATLRAADAITTVSNVLRAHLIERGIPADRITVNPNGADLAAFRPEAADRELQARLGRDQLLVGFIGSFASFHGIAMLRAAIARVLPARPRVTFVMVGAGRLATELQEQCRQLGLAERVHFTGFVPRERVPGIAAAMDVLLAPYPPNDFFYFSPIKLFEYMASGRAVLAARVGQIAEVVEDCVNGMLHEPGDAADLSTKLLTLIDDASLRARLGRAARRTAEREYSWQANAIRLGNVIARAMATARPAPLWEASSMTEAAR
jgi:glycosyltransferase involved in cell wall biosynthesis